MAPAQDRRNRLYMAGAPGGGSISPPAHNYIAQCLARDWEMSFLEASTLQAVLRAFRAPSFAGGIVTMPWKSCIIPFLDKADEIVFKLGACNHVSVTEEGTLHGTNTDWVGINNALRQVVGMARPGRKGLVVGAGGASRAAVYTLFTGFGCRDIYIVNRDKEEASQLIQSVQNYEPTHRPNLTHVQTAEEAQSLTRPDYIVSTVPDFEPSTAAEVEARAVLVSFLSRKDASTPGFMLDMCYHPLLTQNLQLARQYGWHVIDGVQVVGHQLKEQWRLWTGEEIGGEVDEVAWEILKERASTDPTVMDGKTEQ